MTDYKEEIHNLYYNLESFINNYFKNIKYNNYTLSNNDLLIILLGCIIHPDLYDIFLDKLLSSKIKIIEIDSLLFHKYENINFNILKLVNTLKKFKYSLKIKIMFNDL